MRLNALEFALMNNRVREWSQRTLETPTLIGGRGALRGLRVLEVGCGRGVGVEILLEQLGSAKVVAFDFDPRMVALARARTARVIARDASVPRRLARGRTFADAAVRRVVRADASRGDCTPATAPADETHRRVD